MTRPASEEPYQQSLAEREIILVFARGRHQTEKQHEDAEENVRVVREAHDQREEHQVRDRQPRGNAPPLVLLHFQPAEFLPENPGHHRRRNRARAGGPPAEMLEHERHVPDPLGRDHQHRRRGEMRQRAADGDVDEQQSQRPVSQLADDVTVEVTALEYQGQQGHRRRFRDERPEQRPENQRRDVERHQDVEDPGHGEALLAQRRQGRRQHQWVRFMNLSPVAEACFQALEQRRENSRHRLLKILALSEHYGVDATARALLDAYDLQAIGADYIANILHQRSQPEVTLGALHLIRASDQLELDLAPPDLSLYERSGGAA